MFYDRSDELLYEEDIHNITFESALDSLDLSADQELGLLGRHLLHQTGFEIPLQVKVDWEEFTKELKEEVRKQTLGYILGKLGLVRLLTEMAAYSVTGRVAPITTRIAGRTIVTGVSAGAVGTRFIGPVTDPRRLKLSRQVATGARIGGRILLVFGVVMTIADIVHFIRTGRFFGFQLMDRPPIEIIMDGE